MNTQSPVPSVIDKADRTHMPAGMGVNAIVPQSFEQAWRFAQLIAGSGMAPKGFERPEAAMVAILHGLELGLMPMAALQSIAVVNGRPTVYGDGAIGLVRGSGLCEWIKETIAGDGDAMTATCQAKRCGDPEPATGTFSVADAKKAGLWSKSGPWTQYPKRMLGARARAFALRDGFADVLRGISIKEEQEDVVRVRDAEKIRADHARDVTPPRSAPKPPAAPQTTLTPPKPPAQPSHQAEIVQTTELDRTTDWLVEVESYTNCLAACEAEESLAEAIESYGNVFEDAPQDIRDRARAAETAKRAEIDRQAGSGVEDTPADPREAVLHDLRSAIMSGDRRVSALLNDLPAERRALVTDADVKDLKEAQRAIEAQRNGGGR